MKYRIKQIANDIFIAQCKKWYDYQWESIDNINNFVWYTTESYSNNKTYEEALCVIERYKKYLKEKNKYPKYYKL